MIKYITRGNQSPQGKQKVYFCCHPDEFDKYLHPIADEILQKHDCAVFYYEPKDTVSQEEYELDMKGMCFFVIPVTTKLLTTQNPALDRDFNFATEHKIAVLPIMQESGLDELFEKKCGNLQYLDKNNTDPTAISYDGKLKKFLDGIFSGDILGSEYNPDKEMERIKNDIEKYKTLADKTGMAEYRRFMAMSIDELGTIFKSEGNLEEAREHYQKCFGIFKALAEETGEYVERRSLYIAYLRLGDVSEAEGKLDEAMEYYQKSYETIKALFDEIDELDEESDKKLRFKEDVRKNLAISYERLGGLSEAEGNINEAMQYYRDGLFILMS